MSKIRVNRIVFLSILLSVVIIWLGFTNVVRAEADPSDPEALFPGCYQDIGDEKLKEILDSVHFETNPYDKGSGKPIQVTASRCGLKFEKIYLYMNMPKPNGIDYFQLLIVLSVKDIDSDLLTLESFSFVPVSPKELEEGQDNGEYRIRTVLLKDMTTNIDYANFSIAEAFYKKTITITGTEYRIDETPPVLTEVSVDTKEVKAGDIVKVTATVIDDLSGVFSVNVALGIEGWNAAVNNIYLEKDKGSDNKWSGEIEIPSYLNECNIDVLNVEVMDEMKNPRLYSRLDIGADFPDSVKSISIHVIPDSANADTIPPVLSDLSVEGPVSINVGAIVTLIAHGTDSSDSNIGIKEYFPMIAKMTGTMKLRGYDYSVKVDFIEALNDGEYECIWPIDDTYYDGIYDLIAVDLIDLAGNSAKYTIDNESKLPANISVTVNNPANPIPPVVASFDCASVTLVALEGYEYSKDGSNWQDGVTFSGLTSDTSYTFYQCIKLYGGKGDAKASSISVTTKKHEYGEWKVVKEATDETEGSRERVCSVCSHKETEIIPKREKPDVTQKYDDVDAGRWYVEYIQKVVDRGLMVGISSNTFGPNRSCTRAMFVQILYNAEGKPSVKGISNPFKDVQKGKWYTDAVLWAYANKVTVGTSKDTFGTNDKMSRQQMATFLYRYAKAQGLDVSKTKSLDSFKDKKEIENYSKAAIKWAYGIGIMLGKSADKLDPARNATRAEAATVVSRYLDYYKL